MILVSQLILLVGVSSLMFGPVARFGLSHIFTADLFLIALWLFCWLGSQKIALHWAVMSGLVVDSVNFHYFGLYLITYLIIVVSISYLKNHYFQVTSLFEAIICLAVANVITLGVGYVSGATFFWQQWLFSIIVNAILGSFLYYFVATRFRLFSMWRGSQL